MENRFKLNEKQLKEMLLVTNVKLNVPVSELANEQGIEALEMQEKVNQSNFKVRSKQNLESKK